MSDAYTQVPPNSTGAKIDQEELTVGSVLVRRQRNVHSDPVDPNGHGRVKNGLPSSTDYGLVMRAAPSGLSEAVIDLATATDHDLIAAVSGQIIKVWQLLLWSNGDQTLTIKDGGTALAGAMDFAQGGRLVLPKEADPWFTLSVNSPFRLTMTQAAQLSGRVYYTQG